ncbi:protein-glutamate methylesterase/protein-glutamine glutaminase [Dethiosulfovibrio salsuginis]|uniref:Protein-glutamate methylesterase/protein-glutamine glutaminase n=1 Tax=Dethiosulfovibrio salsuginis TaxID=561720 RepID=A0A1X7JN65_9BACT|nr:chemotaxis response regulator protein-glutamate methylesterase [Dethiosulfovibrio salsuginis]SMG29660.1 two-component system, chemotaxis family, response regulator CheB [Dethiosulfovibrio salsuginis]
MTKVTGIRQPKNMKEIRVLVVDDSSFMRKVIGDILDEVPGISVVARARDGIDGLAKVESLRPDVITLDVEMPRKNGIDTLREIMDRFPTPVIMVSSLTQSGATITMQALSMGAVDFVAKPSGTISLNMREVGDELRQKVLAAAYAKSVLPGKPFPLKARDPESVRPSVSRGIIKPPMPGSRPKLVCIASSTGGPQALQRMLTALPGDFPLPIVIAQHMPKGFTASFASRLDDLCSIDVKEGAEGIRLRPGLAVIAPGGYHMVIRGGPKDMTIGLSDSPPVLSVKPSANVLFSSVADAIGGDVVAVILTGMGRDGTDGAQVLSSKGAYVFGEAPETCVVYGMPRSAMEAGVINEQLPLHDMAGALNRFVREKR